MYSDDDLKVPKAMPKTATNPQARWVEKPKGVASHGQRRFEVEGEGGVRFAIYRRQNLLDESDFSCGIHYCPVGATPLTLARYNGPSHVHGDIRFRPHIHEATVEAILAGRRAESEATETDRYTTLEGATACLLEDFHVRGIAAEHYQPGIPGLG